MYMYLWYKFLSCKFHFNYKTVNRASCILLSITRFHFFFYCKLVYCLRILYLASPFCWKWRNCSPLRKYSYLFSSSDSSTSLTRLTQPFSHLFIVCIYWSYPRSEYSCNTASWTLNNNKPIITFSCYDLYENLRQYSN